MSDLDKLDGPELAACVAVVVMGWKKSEPHNPIKYWTTSAAPILCSFYRPDRNDRQAREMEDALERRGLCKRYANELYQGVVVDFYGGRLRHSRVIPQWRIHWLLAHATLPQRCRAAIRTVEAETPATEQPPQPGCGHTDYRGRVCRGGW